MRGLRKHLVLGALVLAPTIAAAPLRAATITIVNLDGPGEGFNDPTPAAPVGGNDGATVGAQRLQVFERAARIWGGLLPSTVEIRVNARFDPQSCTATSGVLGSAGPVLNVRDFPGAPFAGTWYHVALGNKLAGSDQLPANNDINATFNAGIGGAGCLPQGWYYGFDGNEGGQIELLPVVLHELGHGLGFSTSTSGVSGSMLNGFPHIYDRNLYDNVTGLHWNQMSNAQRAATSTQCRELVWSGAHTTAAAAVKLGDKPVLTVNAPASIDGDYEVGAATFGPALTAGGVTGAVVLVQDSFGNPTNGCESLVNGAAVAGKIAFIDRGTCGFPVKVKNAQNAGAIAVIVADTVAGCPPGGMTGVDPTITIPAVRVTLADGNAIRAQLGVGVSATLRVDPTKLAGTDAAGRVKVYTPNPYASGSSIAHWDVSAQPNLLMEPSLNASLSSDVDLAQAHFADIGWYTPLVAVGDREAAPHRLGASAPNPSAGVATIDFTLARGDAADLAIYDLGGRLVRRVASGRFPEGAHRVRWDGRDDGGRAVAPGVYVYRLTTPAFQASRHLAIVR